MSSDLAQQVMSEKIKLNSIVKITQYACNALNASRCAAGALNRTNSSGEGLAPGRRLQRHATHEPTFSPGLARGVQDAS